MYNRSAFRSGESSGGSGATTGYHCCNRGGAVRGSHGGAGRKISSNRTLVRAEVFYVYSTSDLPRIVLLSARLSHAVQSVPVLVRDHVGQSSPACDCLREGAGRKAGCASDGSTTVGDGGMVRADPSVGVRSNLGQGKDRDREGRDCK